MVTPDPVSLGDTPESWPVATSEYLFRNDWVMALRRDEISAPGSDETFGRLVLEHPGAVVVLAVDDQERVLCLRQYRHPGGHRFVELPAGLLDAQGEEPLDVARRELREEAGLEASEWVPLTAAYSSPGISSELIHYFLARGLSEVDHDFERRHEEAEMDVFWAPYSEVYDAAVNGRVTDAPLVVAVLVAHARGLVGR